MKEGEHISSSEFRVAGTRLINPAKGGANSRSADWQSAPAEAGRIGNPQTLPVTNALPTDSRSRRGGSRLPVCATPPRRAFSLIEMMVVVALLSVIVLGLMAMFNQTQRAFRLGMSQTDVLESGRMATELIARVLEQMTPSYYNSSNRLPNGVLYPTPNFDSEITNAAWQSLPGGNGFLFRTNIMTDVFFMVRQNQTLTGIGYFVRTNRLDIPSLPGGVGPAGTLFRFETNNSISQFQQNPSGLFAGFNDVRNQINLTNVSKVLDGVVQFKIKPFDTDGWVLPNNPSWYTNWVNPNFNPNSPNSMPSSMTNGNVVAIKSFPAAREVGLYKFFSNAVPASVELELGILEQQIYERYKSIPIDVAQKSFLTNQAAHVHLFRQRISIRNVDPSAYQ